LKTGLPGELKIGNRQLKIGNDTIVAARLVASNKSSGCGEYIKPIDEKETLVWYR
jgi:hypothetical protein